MTPHDYISVNGSIVAANSDFEGLEQLRAGYVRQDMRAHNRRPLHIAAHLDLMCRTFEQMFARRVMLSPAMVSAWCGELLARNRYPSTGSCHVTALLIPSERGTDLVLIGGEILLDEGYSVRPIRPTASIDRYDFGFDQLPTSGAFEAAEMALLRARNRLGVQGSHVVLRIDDERVVLSAGTAPLFAIEGRTIITTPLAYGAPDTVERRLTLDAIARTNLTLSEQAILADELARFDELFFADYRGLTSIEGIESTNYMSLMVDRIVRAMR